jgi:protein-tyrosine-phosphatase
MEEIEMSQNHEQTRVLFVCVENAGRSQMAEAFANRKGFLASSAGTQPALSVNPAVVEAMAEKAFNFSFKKPKMLTIEMIDKADLVITMGCSVEKVCPRPMLERMQKKVIDWGLEDPKGKPLPEVRRIRNEIERRVEELAKSRRPALQP